MLAADSFGSFLVAISVFCHEGFSFYKHRHSGSADSTLLSLPLIRLVEKSHLTGADSDLPGLLSKHAHLAGCPLFVATMGAVEAAGCEVLVPGKNGLGFRCHKPLSDMHSFH